MNILIIGKFYEEGFAQHISETLKEMGHAVLNFQVGQNNKKSIPGLKYIQKGYHAAYSIYQQTPYSTKRTVSSLISAVKNKNIELTIVCHDFLKPASVSALKKETGSKICLWFPDHIAAVKRGYFINANYDYLFFKDPYIVKTYQNELGIENAFYLPECCNPNYHKRVQLSKADIDKYSCDLSTAGNLHTPRIAVFSHLKGYNVKIWGNPAPWWAYTKNIKSFIQNKFVANEEKSKAFFASKIVLNNLQPAEIFGVNVRVFEIAAAGGFQIVTWRPGLQQLYNIESEIVTFKTINELKEKIDYYLTHEDERRSIANLAHKRTQKEHTYNKRLQLLIDTTFNSKKGYELLDNYYL